MKDLYDKTCEDWNKLCVETEGNLRVECRDGQRFYCISHDTSIANFLTFPDNESNDVLLKVTDISFCHVYQTIRCVLF